MPFRDVDIEFDSEKMKRQLGLDPTRPIADRYCHYRTCEWAVVELKGSSHFRRAIDQLKSTIQQLRAKGHKVDFALVIMKKLRPPESRLFVVDTRTHEVYMRTAKAKRVEIYNLPVLLYYEEEIRQIEERDRLWGFT